MEIKGKVLQILGGVTSGISKTGKPWSKSEILIETEGQYPKKIKLSNMKNAESFSLIPVGAFGIFQIELESREYNGKWYTEATCWKYEIPGAYEQPDVSPQFTVDPPYQASKASYSDFNVLTKEMPKTEQTSDSDEDLPF